MSRDWRMYMTGVVTGSLANGALRLVGPPPWWLGLPLALGGAWVCAGLALAWWRAR